MGEWVKVWVWVRVCLVMHDGVHGVVCFGVGAVCEMAGKVCACVCLFVVALCHSNTNSVISRR